MAAFSVKWFNDNTSYRKVYIILILLSVLFPQQSCAWTSGATNFVVHKDGNSMNANHPFIDQSDIFLCPAFMNNGDYSLIQPHCNIEYMNTDIHEHSDIANYPFVDQSVYYQCPEPTYGDDYCLIQPNQNTQCKITDIHQDLDAQYHFSPMSMPNGFLFFAVCLPSYVPIEHYQSNLSHFSYSKDDGNTDAQNEDVVSYHETPGNVYTPNR